MHRTHVSLFTLLCLTIIAGCSTPTATMFRQTSAPSIQYHVSLSDPSEEKFKVTAVVSGFTGDMSVFQFPIWAPGAYDIVNFGAYVSDFTATGADGKPLQFKRSDTSTFRILRPGTTFRVQYTVHDIEQVRNSMWFCISDIEPDYAFAVGTALYGYPKDFKDVPCTVRFTAPKGWDVAVALDSAADGYHARDYDELVDAPVQMGKFSRRDFMIDGKQHTVTLTTMGVSEQIDINKIAAATDTVARLVSGFFGEMPYKRYLFQYYLVNPMSAKLRSMFGALEHRNSSTYMMPWFPGSAVDLSLTAVIAHEYWHLWSPKRIHVHQLGPFDYQSAPRTTSLWFAEGLTEYYARLLLQRGGMTKSARFLYEVEGDMKDLYGRKQTTPIAELSYNISQAAPSEILPLYSTGPVIGLLLDADIRLQTDNRKSLDDVMRYFNEEYGKTGKSFGDDEIIPIMERVTGAKLADFYNRYISGHDPLPFDDYFPKIGLRYVMEEESRKGLAAELEKVSEGWKIVSVIRNGSADLMGLKPGDLITRMLSTTEPISAQGFPMDAADYFIASPQFKGLEVQQNGKQIVVTGPVVSTLVPVRHLKIDEAATGQALAIRQSMLGF
jgi:predicted metalloprotease with PDZ domain